MEKVKYVIYKRLSKEDKSRTQHGFSSQQLDIDYYLESNTGEIIGSFEEFVSGGADVKPELDRAIDLCKKEGAVLLISKLDRLSRRVSQVASYMESEITFKVATMPSANNFTLHIFSALAEEERASIRNRVKRGLAAAKAKGVKLGGSSKKHRESFKRNKALGLHKENRTIEASRTRAEPVIEEIKKIIRYSSDRLTQEQIAQSLNTSGFKTPKGGDFSKSSVSRMIKKYNINEYNNKNKLTKAST